MKTILSILVLLVALSASALDRITATITITNTPADGNTLTVNGDVRTWKTTVVTPATQISITNVVGYSATNLFNQAAAYIYAGPLALSYSSTNGIQLIARSGNALVVSASGTWCTITMSTQAVTGMLAVRTPISGEPTATVRTNIASDLAQGLSDYSTTSIAASSVFGSNFVNLSAPQTVTGAKTFTGANVLSNSSQIISGGTVTNVALKNATEISGTLGSTTNGNIYNANLVNGNNTGDAFRSPGTGTASEQFGYTAHASGDYSVAFGNQTDATGQGASAVGGNASSIYDNGTALGYLAAVTAPSGTALGAHATAGHTNSSALGVSATTTADHQLMFGTAAEYGHFPGNVQIVGNITNVHAVGVNTVDGQVSYLRKNITTLVNGAPNLISTSTNLFLKLSGPTGAFTINAMDGGSDGRMLILYNITGQTMTIANNSGSLGVAANRILTGTGADVVGVYAATFIYDSAQSLWVMISKN